MSNYFDASGNYINTENLSLAEIYARGIEAGRQEQAEAKAKRRLRSDIQESETTLTTYWREPRSLHPIPDNIAVCNNCFNGATKDRVKEYKFCPWCGAKVVPAPASGKMNADVTNETDDVRKLMEEDRLLDERDDSRVGRAYE